MIRIVVKLFAGLRERAGVPERELELPEGSCAADLWGALSGWLGEPPPGLLIAVNQEYAGPEQPLAEGDEVALIPPVSGGAFQLTQGSIDLQALVASVTDERVGAVASFVGTTRARSRGRTVRYLEYEAYHGMAERVMAEIATALRERYDLCEVAIIHRVGRVAIGEASVAIAVSAAHRGDALAACQEAIDTLKQTVPLWKREVYEDGEEWIGRGS